MPDLADPTTRPEPRPSGLQIRHRPAGERSVVVAMEGEVDLASAPELKSTLCELLAQGNRRFVLDLSRVRHMDSTGLGVLVGFQRKLTDEGLMAIAAAPRNVTSVFELTGLDRTLDMFASLDAAVAHAHGHREGSARAPLSPDAAIVVGLASTAMPFAGTAREEAERWLRVLRCHGEAGQALTAVGLSESPLEALPDDGGAPAAGPEDRDAVALAIEHAAQVARRRGASAVGTVDLLMGVMSVYGEDFDRVLQAHGSDRDEVIERLGA